ncbi:LysR family transcriptional regulator [Streptomyces sp. NBC_00582]|uniref:LysR family transcriptional regulator n=1 Tax=Streptomyces sp. NBC_00582 TaxID=2975783 RepID=UPI001062F7AF|nr:LysR family transcriptional regulator [Streptomyces sp. NBC_00582]WUB63165.1 LysR family transcriptional regulator [Streptomyces sp. NBC_00582]
MKPQPDLKLLSTFLSVVDRGSMAEAAAALGYVPSAVSQHIAALERDMGVELLVRRPGSRLILTAAGRSLAQAAGTLFEATARFQDAAARIADREIAELRVGAYPSAMSHLFPGVLAALRPRSRGARIRLVIVETHAGLPRVTSGDLDLLIAYRYLPEDPPAPSADWNVTSVGHEPLFLVAGPRPDARPWELTDCLTMEWTSGHARSPDRRLLHRWAGELGISPEVTLETEDLHSMLAMIRAGLAVGLIPATLLGEHTDDPRVRRVTLPPEAAPLHREVLAVSRPGPRPPIVDELLALLGEALTLVTR